VLLVRRTFCKWPSLRRSPLATRRDHRERHPPPVRIDIDDPHRHDIPNRYDVIRGLDVAVSHLANVDQPAVLQPDIHKRSEIDDIQNRTLQFHPRLKVFEFQNALLENRRRQILPWIAAGASQGIENVAYGRHTRLQPRGHFLGINCFELLPQFFNLGPVTQVGGSEA
jgi:hypothetical protein